MKIKRDIQNDRFLFKCPGCKTGHFFNGGWKYNGEPNSPTITPSILVEYTELPDPMPEKGEDGKYPTREDGKILGCKDMRCHSFVTGGKIQFLDDCTHELKGQTVDLPDMP
jgi:hypothetical protein